LPRTPKIPGRRWLTGPALRVVDECKRVVITLIP
jgi:hypothetical protein